MRKETVLDVQEALTEVNTMVGFQNPTIKGGGILVVLMMILEALQDQNQLLCDIEHTIRGDR